MYNANMKLLGVHGQSWWKEEKNVGENWTPYHQHK